MIPKFVTETSTSPPWQDCTIASGLMAANKMTDGQFPSTTAERLALRRATGDTVGGVSLDTLNYGLKQRYGIRLLLPSGQVWSDVKTWLSDKGGAVIQGNYRLLGEPYTRWDRNFAARTLGAHAMYADHYRQEIDSVFIMDPLGRGTDNHGEPYSGEYMKATAVRSFMQGLRHWDGSLYVSYAPNKEQPSVPPVQEDNEVKFVSTSGYEVTSRFILNVKAGTPVYYFDGKTVMTKIAKDSTVDLLGLADAHTDNFVVEISSAGPYFDSVVRPTLGIIKGGTPQEKK